jgi:hypothetical protein
VYEDGDHQPGGDPARGRALHAVDDLRGRIWRRVIAEEELASLEREHTVISTRLFAGRTVVSVYSEAAAVGLPVFLPICERTKLISRLRSLSLDLVVSSAR